MILTEEVEILAMLREYGKSETISRLAKAEPSYNNLQCKSVQARLATTWGYSKDQK